MNSSTAVAFNPDIQKRFEAVVAKYERKASALLPTLYLAQEQFGFLSPQVMVHVAKLLEMPPREVFEAVSFYTMFRKKDMGQYCLQVCQNVTCGMMGSDDLFKVIKEELGIGPGEVTADKKFSLVPVQCLGSCDTAPVVQINDDYVERLDPEKFRSLLKRLQSGEVIDLEATGQKGGTA
jgi:NADH-quinone oxidoreductase E subunit